MSSGVEVTFRSVTRWYFVKAPLLNVIRKRLNTVNTLRDITREQPSAMRPTRTMTSTMTGEGVRERNRQCALGCSWSGLGFAIGFEVAGAILARVAGLPLIGMVTVLAVATIVLVHAWRHH